MVQSVEYGCKDAERDFDSAINSLALHSSARLLAESFYDIYCGKIIPSGGKNGGVGTQSYDPERSFHASLGDKGETNE